MAESESRPLDTRIAVLAKPENERTVVDVHAYVSSQAEDARRTYEEMDVDKTVSQEMKTRFFDRWSNLDDAQKGLEGKAPVSKTLDYLRTEIVNLKATQKVVEQDIPEASLFGDKEKQRQLQGAMSYIQVNLAFFNQAVDLVTNDWELKRQVGVAEETP